MARWLDATDTTFESDFADLLAAKREVSADVDETVAAILADVQARGDEALIDYTMKFDRLDLREAGIAVSKEDRDAALGMISEELRVALELAHSRITSHHQKQMPGDLRYTDNLGVQLGHRWTAVESVGLYVPGGLASYPSSVLMNAVPAKVAGVERIAMVVPTPDGDVNHKVLAAAAIAGVDEIYRVGGAQAIAALAYGTPIIEPVVKIVGPGNAFVAAAKRRVFGHVGIDMIAGPSEVLIIADKENNPDWIAADLIAQAEHDESAQSILITDDADFGRAVSDAVDRQLTTLPRKNIAGKSWADFGAIICIHSIEDAIPLADRIAAEHLEIAVADEDALASKIRNAGAIFLGAHTPEVLGDYVGGSNHVLPTARSARFSSGLSVYDFLKRTSILKCDADSLRALADAAITIGEAEGLDGHARSAAIRINRG